MSATLLFTIWCWCALFSAAATPLTLLSLSGAITTSHFLIHRLVVEGAGNVGYAAARTLRCTLHPPNLTAVDQIFIHGEDHERRKGQGYTNPCVQLHKQASLEEVMPKIWLQYK